MIIFGVIYFDVIRRLEDLFHIGEDVGSCHSLRVRTSDVSSHDSSDFDRIQHGQQFLTVGLVRVPVAELFKLQCAFVACRFTQF